MGCKLFLERICLGFLLVFLSFFFPGSLGFCLRNPDAPASAGLCDCRKPPESCKNICFTHYHLGCKKQQLQTHLVSGFITQVCCGLSPEHIHPVTSRRSSSLFQHQIVHLFNLFVVYLREGSRDLFDLFEPLACISFISATEQCNVR